MKKLMFMAALLALTACGNVDTIQQTEDEKAKAKVEETTASEPKENTGEKKNDIWTYYENAKWSDDFNGLKTNIQKVVVSDKAPGVDDNGKEIVTSAVGVKFQLENTTEGKFTTYPDQAELVTSTGEQVHANLFFSENIGGEIDKGVIKEGDVFFYLDRGHAEDIEWVKLSWSARQGAEEEILDGESKDYEVELKLK